MDISLSGEDIYRLLDGHVRIIDTYSDIKKYNSIEDLLGPYEQVVILYNITQDYGHWVCIFKYPNSNVVEFFDPYASLPDKELEYAKEAGKETYLVRLLYKWAKDGGQVEYNDKPLQRLAKNVNTCGRWVVLRLLLKRLNLNQFASLFKNLPISPDELISN